MPSHDASISAAAGATGATLLAPDRMDTTGLVIDPWRIVSSDCDPAHAARHESLFALANGALGVRGGFEEDASTSQGSFLTAAWERTPIEYHERFPGFARHSDTRIPVADGTHIGLRLGDTPVSLAEGEWLAFERVLDLRHGCLQRHLCWRSPTGATLEIDAGRIVPLSTPGLLCIRYRVSSIDYSGPITLTSALIASHTATAQGDDPRIGTRAEHSLQVTSTAADATLATVGQRTRHSHIALACGQRHHLPDDSLTFANADADNHGARQSFTGTLAPGASVVLEKYVAYAWSEPGDDSAPERWPDAVATALQTAVASGFEAHRAAQARDCATFWRDVDLAVDGDPATEQALRFNLFHLLQSISRDGSGSAAAKSLTGEGYEGHYFWDAEAFVLPALVFLAPALARNMLVYRIRTLERARAHAREMNHARGALYPWRTISGDECSAYFPSGSAQYHINAAIAFALQLYMDATSDTPLLLEGGAEMLFETARLWLQVGFYDPRREHAFCICQVTGPDEYTALVDNNHYTNRMAQQHLRHAAATAATLAQAFPAEYARIAASIDLHDDEIATWSAAAEAMYLPVDPALGIYPQDDAFLDKPRLPAELAGERGQPLLLRLHPLTIYRHQVCKQADVLQAFMLAGEHADRDSKRRNFDYYEGVTVHDSTLSASTFGIVAADVGYADKAWRYFQDALRVDLDDLHGNTAHGVHLAAMAGSWLGLAWGFGGLRPSGGQLAFAPSLPAAWDGYHFGVRWQGQRLRVAVRPGTVEYTLVEGERLRILHRGQALELHASQSLSLPLTAPSIFPRPFKAVIFDLDGVIADTAVLHDAAWKKLAHEIGVPFDDALGERLKGVDRRGSLEILLERADRPYSEAEKLALTERKNSYYREQAERLGPQDLMPGAHAAVESVRHAGLRIGLASASRNAPLLLQRLGIAELFDYIVDAATISRSKPDPEIFLAAAAGLGVAPADCLGVEDAAAGVASIHAAGMLAVGIGSATALDRAEAVLPGLADFDITRFATPEKNTPEKSRQEAHGQRPSLTRSTTSSGEQPT